MKDYHILFTDLDGTLIKTASGKTFAEDFTDFRVRKDVLDKIKQMDRNGGIRLIVIVTNQGGIPQYISRQDFELKLDVIRELVYGYTGINCLGYYCSDINKDNPDRKPNTGMLERAWRTWVRNDSDKSQCLMIGDASGKEGQFSDSDKKTAENFGIDYMDVEDFVNSK